MSGMWVIITITQIMIPVNLEKQLIPGTFEYRLNYLIDKELDLSVVRQKYRNENKGASAYDPAILLKIVLFAYSRGIISSRKMEALCRENVICIALTADSHPHFTTIAKFVADSGYHSENSVGDTFERQVDAYLVRQTVPQS